MATEVDKLSDVAVKAAKPKDKPYKLADGRGMYLHVMPNGSKYWRLKYRYATKERAPLALGVYPDVSLKAARKAAADARELLRSGQDPGNVRRVEKLARVTAAASSFEAVALEWMDKERNRWTPGYAKRVGWYFEKNLFPWLGHRPIADITPQELLAVLKRTESKGILETAYRTKQVAGKVFRYAVGSGRAERDVTQDLRDQLKTPTKKHLAAITNPKEVGRLLVAMDGFVGTPVVRAALLLSPLLFCRPGELRQIEWSEVDFEKSALIFLLRK